MERGIPFHLKCPFGAARCPNGGFPKRRGFGVKGRFQRKSPSKAGPCRPKTPPAGPIFSLLPPTAPTGLLCALRARGAGESEGREGAERRAVRSCASAQSVSMRAESFFPCIAVFLFTLVLLFPPAFSFFSPSHLLRRHKKAGAAFLLPPLFVHTRGVFYLSSTLAPTSSS